MTPSESANTPDADASPRVTCIVEQVSHNYGQMAALTDVTFTANRGEMVALVGQSGAGKTTLLRLITGMLRPTSGRISVHGEEPFDVRKSSERARLVGMVQQRLDLVPQLSARHNVDAGMLGQWNVLKSLVHLVLPITNRSSTSALARVGLADRADQRVSRLSGGQQQRVAIARVLAQDPQVIVADEPVASLDPDLAGELLQLLREIAKERNRTVIASVHDPALATSHFDRVIGLRDGSLQFNVPALEVSSEMLTTLYGRGSRAQTGRGGKSSEARALWGV